MSGSTEIPYDVLDSTAAYTWSLGWIHRGAVSAVATMLDSLIDSAGRVRRAIPVEVMDVVLAGEKRIKVEENWLGTANVEPPKGRELATHAKSRLFLPPG